MELQELMAKIKEQLVGKQAPENVPPFTETQVNSIQKSVFWVVHNHYDLGQPLDALITYAARADQPVDEFLDQYQNEILEAYKHSKTHAK